MNQSTFSSVPEAPSGTTSAAEAKDQPRRPLLLIGFVALLGLAVASYLLFLTGDADPEAAVLTPVTNGETVTTDVVPGPTPEPITKATQPSFTPGSVDPFKALVVAEADAPSEPQATPAAPGPSVDSETVSTLPGLEPLVVPGDGGSTSAAPAPTGGATPSATAAPELAVEVFSVEEDNLKALIDVNGKEFSVVTGASFGEGFSLVRIEGGTCTTIKFQDDSFDLCEGETRTVS